jgi:hypothetical protein
MTSMMFLEYFLDVERNDEWKLWLPNDPDWDRVKCEKRTVIHEALHQKPFDLNHLPDSIMSAVFLDKYDNLDPEHIKLIRERMSNDP